MADATDTLLAERAKTHGDFTEHATVTQYLKDTMRSFPGWEKLTPAMKESLDMNAHKIGRILAGNPAYADHWDDIAGYARLVSQRVTAPKSADLLKKENVTAISVKQG